jgi:hypothetical protein
MQDSTTFIDTISPADQATAGNSHTPRFMAYYFYVGGVLTALAAAAVLVATSADAQTAGPAPFASAESQPAAAPATLPDAAKPPPRYSATDIERAFNFMDANKDGKISREEAAGFRNVAKHFDAADTDKDGTLSLAEFGQALNRP